MQREQLPRQLRSDEIPGGAWCNRLLSAVKAIWPVETPTIRPVTTMDGTGYEAKGSSGSGGGGSVGNAFFARVEWDTDSYDWAELEWDGSEDDGTWVDKSGGRQTAGITSGTGSGTQDKAFEQSGLTSVPTDTRVLMYSTTSDEGGTVWVFVPVEFTQVTFVTALQVTATSVQYKTQTGYVLLPGTESSWTNLSSTVCPP